MNRLKRRHDRGFYDHDTVHALPDAAVLCHVSYVVDGLPCCTPTLFCRMLRSLSAGQPACLAVTHPDALVPARCGFNHSADYRSVMASGNARPVDHPAKQAAALVAMVGRFSRPGRPAGLRPSTAPEIKATSVIAMDIERASAEVRAKGVADDDADCALPIYAERLPVRLVMGEPEPCPRLMEGVARPDTPAGYRVGRALEEAVLEAHAVTYP